MTRKIKQYETMPSEGLNPIDVSERYCPRVRLMKGMVECEQDRSYPQRLLK
jgi:hypothetical protein